MDWALGNGDVCGMMALLTVLWVGGMSSLVCLCVKVGVREKWVCHAKAVW